LVRDPAGVGKAVATAVDDASNKLKENSGRIGEFSCVLEASTHAWPSATANSCQTGIAPAAALLHA
jgi:hypothetical protein